MPISSSSAWVNTKQIKKAQPHTLRICLHPFLLTCCAQLGQRADKSCEHPKWFPLREENWTGGDVTCWPADQNKWHTHTCRLVADEGNKSAYAVSEVWSAVWRVCFHRSSCFLLYRNTLQNCGGADLTYFFSMNDFNCLYYLYRNPLIQGSVYSPM